MTPIIFDSLTRYFERDRTRTVNMAHAIFIAHQFLVVSSKVEMYSAWLQARGDGEISE